MSDPITSFDESTLATFSATFELLEEQGILTPTVTLDRLRTSLSADQQAIVDQIIDLDPRDYGVNTPYAGDLEPVPADLVKVSGQQYTEHGEQKTIGEKYVPWHIFDAYVRMNDAFMTEHRTRKLLIQSGYRSPAYQVVVFINWLTNGYDGDIARTIRHASPPRYSQHTIASKAAIDFRNIDGSPSSGTRKILEIRWNTHGSASTAVNSAFTNPGQRAMNSGCGRSRGTGSTGRPSELGAAVTSMYDSQRLAAAYASDRPPVHEQILRSARVARQADRALDVGCGAGLSTAALAPLARRVVGLEPIPAMLAHRRTVAPRASFVIGQAERLPFAAGSFDLVTAAGSLNYADIPSALAEIARVLTADGTFLLYDFSSGRHAVSDDNLERWFASFEQRFPWPPGWQPLDVRELPLAAYGLQLLDFTDVETRLPMGVDAYLRYALSETNVENAIANGACTYEEARDWCCTTLEPVFSEGPVIVVIPGHVATLVRAAEAS